MRKKGICFLVMSLLVVTGYLVAIAGSPSPGWITRWTDGIDGAQTGSLYFNTYVSANYRDLDNDGSNEYHTYHWAQVTGATNTQFRIEFRHSLTTAAPEDIIKKVDDANAPFPDENPASGVYELDLEHSTHDVPHNSTYSPYTALRGIRVEDGGGGTGEVLSSLPNITIP